MSDNNRGMGEAGGRAAGAAVGIAIASGIYTRRQRRLAREAARYLHSGEQLAAPVGYCSRGGQRGVAAGLSVFLLAVVVGLASAAWPGNDALTSALFFGGMGLGVLIMAVSVPLANNFALVLTDQRLLLVRTRGQFRQRLRKLVTEAPRDQVAMEIRSRLTGAAVDLSFAPSTGLEPVSFDAYQNGNGVTYARAIKEAMDRPVRTPASA